MSQENSLPEILLSKPEQSQCVRVSTQADSIYALDFDLLDTTFDVHGEDLSLLFEDGSNLILERFFPVSTESEVFISLDDGTLLQGRDVTEILLMNLHDLICDSYGLEDQQASLSGLLGQAPIPDIGAVVPLADGSFTIPGLELAGAGGMQAGQSATATERASQVAGQGQLSEPLASWFPDQSIYQETPAQDEAGLLENYLRSLFI